MPTTQEIFSQSVEFNRWAHGTDDVLPEEAFMLERHLDHDLNVLEGGVGGGRLLRAMTVRGFRSLAGFDFVPALVEVARRKDTTGKIDIRVLEATSLDYADASFDQAIYLHQIISGVEGDLARRQALR